MNVRKGEPNYGGTEMKKTEQLVFVELLNALKEMHRRNCDPKDIFLHNTGQKPDICFACAAIVRAEEILGVGDNR